MTLFRTLAKRISDGIYYSFPLPKKQKLSKLAHAQRWVFRRLQLFLCNVAGLADRDSLGLAATVSLFVTAPLSLPLARCLLCALLGLSYLPDSFSYTFRNPSSIHATCLSKGLPRSSCPQAAPSSIRAPRATRTLRSERCGNKALPIQVPGRSIPISGYVSCCMTSSSISWSGRRMTKEIGGQELEASG